MLKYINPTSVSIVLFVKMVECSCCDDCLAIESKFKDLKKECDYFFDYLKDAPYLRIIDVEVSVKIPHTSFDFILQRCKELDLDADIYGLYCQVFYPDFKFVIFQKQRNSTCDMQHVIIKCTKITDVSESIAELGNFIRDVGRPNCDYLHNHYKLAVNAVSEIENPEDSRLWIDLDEVIYTKNFTTPKFTSPEVTLSYSNSQIFYHTANCLASLSAYGRMTFIGATKLSDIKALYRFIVLSVAAAKYNTKNKEYLHRLDINKNRKYEYEAESDTESNSSWIEGFCSCYGY
jgi:hypothetical protein